MILGRCSYRNWLRALLINQLQITRQNRKGHHGMREQDHSTMGRLDRRL